MHDTSGISFYLQNKSCTMHEPWRQAELRLNGNFNTKVFIRKVYMYIYRKGCQIKILPFYTFSQCELIASPVKIEQ